MLSRRLQRILAKKKKFQYGRRFFKKNKEFKKSEGNDLKKGEPICYECKKPGHIKAECPKLKKDGHKKKDNFRRFKKYKKKAMAVAWENSSDLDSESSSSSDKEKANLAFMANTDDKTLFDVSTSGHSGVHSVDTQAKGLVVNGVWTKTSVAEGEPILGEAQDVQHEAVAVESEGPSAVAEPAAEEAAVPRGSQEIAVNREVAMETPVAQENIAVADSVRSSEDPLSTSSVAYGEQRRIVEEAPLQGEQNIEKEAASQGALSEDALVNEEHIKVQIEVEEQVERRSPSKKTAHRRQKRILKKLHLKPILKRLNDQGEVLTSVQSAVSSVIVHHESMSNDISQISNAMKWLNEELRSMKVMVSEILKYVGPKDPTPPECEPSGQSEGNAGPSGPIGVDLVELPSGLSVDAPAGPSGPSIAVQPSENFSIEDSDICQGSGPEKEILNPVEPVAERADQIVAPEPPASSTLPTLAAPSPPSSSTAPPAPTTFKRPRPRSVSSPQPFPSQFASSLVSSTIVPSPPSSPHLPPASSSAGPSSSGPSSSGPSALPTITPASIFNPPIPPSFITIIPEGAQLTQVEIEDIKDEFEVAILHSILAVGTHTHRTGSSSPVSKKRRLSSTHPISSDLCYPPLWFSLSIPNKQKLIYEEYLQTGHIKADVLAPILSKCERLSPADWTKLYPLSAQQLGDLNASQASSNQPPFSPES
ncbi:hypothetical protein Taro_021134 [Colocasia esculenta]|uniref:CCHC-type domain-containing protein n=1 Tax=Colocasia esculenta TaxID=4460 RepID=A0A843V1K9_COLES|nr:hypothetical protein [Colocasia esculenta]